MHYFFYHIYLCLYFYAYIPCKYRLQQCLVQSFQLTMDSLLIYQITRNSLYFSSTSNARHHASCWKSKQRKKWSLPSRLWLNWDRNGLRISIKREGTIIYHLLLSKCLFVRFSRKTILQGTARDVEVCKWFSHFGVLDSSERVRFYYWI